MCFEIKHKVAAATRDGMGLCHWARSEPDGPTETSNATWLCLPTGVELHNQPATRPYLRTLAELKNDPTLPREWEPDAKNIVRHISPLLKDSLVVTAGLYFGDCAPLRCCARSALAGAARVHTCRSEL